MKTTLTFQAENPEELRQIEKLVKHAGKECCYTCFSRLNLLKDIRQLIKDRGASASLIEIKDVIFKHVY